MKKLILISWSAVALIGLSAHAEMSAIEKRYVRATEIRALVNALQSPVISADLKSTLLERVRPEDKDFAKSLIVRWKAYNDRNLAAEFDELVVRDDQGIETIRMRPLHESRQFEINGRAWKVPEKGSIEKSLRKHLAAQNTARLNSSSMFALLVSPIDSWAQSGKSNSLDIAPIYFYLHASGDEWIEKSPAQSLKENSPRSVLIRRPGAGRLTQGPWGYFFSDRKVWSRIDPVAVDCDGSTARGTARIGEVDMSFVSKPDGTLNLTLPYAGSKVTLLVNSDRDQNTKHKSVVTSWIWVNECNDSECLTLNEAISRNPRSILPWIPAQKLAILEEAKNWKPKDSVAGLQVGSRAPAIEYTDLYGERSVRIETSGGRLSPRDLKDARELESVSNLMLRKELNENQNSLRSLRPLGACCGDTSCRTSLLADRIRLKPTNKGNTAP